MKALTIWQPWASLIIAGAKPYEFRGWRPPRSIIGQRIVIHAAVRRLDRDEAAELYHVLYNRRIDDEIARYAAETCLIPDMALTVLTTALAPGHTPGALGLPFACGLGTAIIGEPVNGFEVAEQFGAPPRGETFPGEANWGWPMLDIEAWPEPIPMRGKQGLWNWPEPEGVIG